MVIEILSIANDSNDAKLVEVALAKSNTKFHLHNEKQLAAGLERLAAHEFSAVLADLRLPDSSGPETVKRIRSLNAEIPIVVLSRRCNSERDAKLLELGAQDSVVLDGTTITVLPRVILHAIQRQQSLVEIRRLLADVRKNHQLLEKKNRHLARLYKTAHKFVDNVSHEFRTPLTVITEYTSLLGDGIIGPVNEEQTRMLNVMQDRTADLNTMVDDMLDVTRLESGLLAVWRKACCVDQIINRVRPAIERKALIKQVTLEFNIDANLPKVYCDEEKVGRIITNLAVNAIKFCGDPGIVRIEVSASADSKGVSFAISDNGPGIDSDNLLLIFERFKRGEADHVGSTDGFGLGLNIAKELVDLNFGQINVESKVGRGSTFSFEIPVDCPVEVLSRYLKHIGRQKKNHTTISLIGIQVDPGVEASLADEADAFLNYILRRDDLLFRTDKHRWLFILRTEETELKYFYARVKKEHRKANRNRPQGPLPEIEMQCEGWWPVAANSDVILARFEHILQPLEPAFV